MTDLDRIIAEMLGWIGPDKSDDESSERKIRDWANRLATLAVSNSYTGIDTSARSVDALAGAAPVAFPRVETGVVQFGDDWPGVFIRGDNAFATAMNLRCEDPVWRNAAVGAVAELLESCNVANTPDVRIIPITHAPAKAREDDRVDYWKQRAKSAEGHLFASDLSEAAKALHKVAALRETPWDELTDVQRWGLEHAALQVIATVNAQRDTRAPKDAALATFAEGE